MESDTYGCSRWQSHHVHPLDVTQNLLENVADIILHCAKAVHIVLPCAKDVMLSSYIMYIPCLPYPISGLSAHGYQLDTHSWTCTMPDSVKTCSGQCSHLIRQKPQEEHQAMGVQDTIP